MVIYRARIKCLDEMMIMSVDRIIPLRGWCWWCFSSPSLRLNFIQPGDFMSGAQTCVRQGWALIRCENEYRAASDKRPKHLLAHCTLFFRKQILIAKWVGRRFGSSLLMLVGLLVVRLQWKNRMMSSISREIQCARYSPGCFVNVCVCRLFAIQVVAVSFQSRQKLV